MTGVNDLQRASDALYAIPADLPRDDWVRVGMAAHDAGIQFDDFDQWSAQAPDYDAKAARSTWRSFKPGKGVGAGTLFAIAKQYGHTVGKPAKRPSSAELAARRAEREKAAAAQDEADEQRHQRALQAVEALLASAKLDPQQHPYWQRKCVNLGKQVRRGAWPQRGWDDALLIPAFDAQRRVMTVEAISASGHKDSLRDGRKSGAIVPVRQFSKASIVLIAEGVATVAAAAECMPECGAVASLGASNMANAARIVRGVNPGATIAIIPDIDPSGTGLAAARKAAEAVGGVVVDLAGVLELERFDAWDVWHHDPETLARAIQQALDAHQAQQAVAAIAAPAPDTLMVLDTPLQQIEAVDGSDDFLADRFIECAPHLRWSPGLGWMVDDGVVWARDDALQRYNCARQVCRAIAAGVAAGGKDGEAKRISSSRTVNAVLTMAQSDRKMMVHVEQWDIDPMLLNTPCGVVDLRTATIRPRGAEYLTQATLVAPDFEAHCPVWLKFLDQVFLGDTAMIEFVQRSAGYWLTGSTKEQVIHFLYGSGSNGKSVLTDLIKRIAGSYTIKLSASALMQSKGERHPTELAQLRGKRMALSSEVGENDFFNEALLKELTGDATLSARFMRGDFFEFQMTQKHVIVGNFKPRLRGGDPAIARRMLLVPFNACFHGDQKDPDLPNKLWAESPAILAWMIQGAAKWYHDGLKVPASVREASAEYMQDHDDLAQWISDCCMVTPSGRAKAKTLYASFSAWKRARGENAPSQTAWGTRLSALPGVGKCHSGGTVYTGLLLKEPTF